jgi:hypothetical protein
MTSPKLRHGTHAGNPEKTGAQSRSERDCGLSRHLAAIPAKLGIQEKNGAQAPPPAYWPHPAIPATDRRPGQAPLGIQKATSFPRLTPPRLRHGKRAGNPENHVIPANAGIQAFSGADCDSTVRAPFRARSFFSSRPKPQAPSLIPGPKPNFTTRVP